VSADASVTASEAADVPEAAVFSDEQPAADNTIPSASTNDAAAFILLFSIKNLSSRYYQKSVPRTSGHALKSHIKRHLPTGKATP
jgi:hypothetical protein